jgi:hypothetical protein
MVEVLVGILLPPTIFGIFALLALWLGAESRPWFDERPVFDDRPNWFPIARRVPRERDEEPPEPDRPRDGTPEPIVQRQPRPAALTRAATSPAGVWSVASRSGS